MFDFRLLLVNFHKVLCSSANTQMLLLKVEQLLYSTNIVCFKFVIDSFDTIANNHLHNYYADQSDFLTRFLTNFMSSVWNFSH